MNFNEVVATGELFKQGSGRKSWNLRKFILCGTLLTYFDQKGTKKGEFDITDCHLERRTAEECNMEPAKHAFAIIGPNKFLLVSASNENNRIMWMKLIEKQIEEFKDELKRFVYHNELVMATGLVKKTGMMGFVATTVNIVLTNFPRLIVLDALSKTLKEQVSWIKADIVKFEKIDETKFKINIANREMKFQVLELAHLSYWQIAFNNIQNSPAFVRKQGKSFAINNDDILVNGVHMDDDEFDAIQEAVEESPSVNFHDDGEEDVVDDEDVDNAEEIEEFEVEEEYVEGADEYEDYFEEDDEYAYNDKEAEYPTESDGQLDYEGSNSENLPPDVRTRRVSFVSHFNLLREAAANIRALFREIEIRSDELMAAAGSFEMSEDDIQQQQEALRTLGDNVTVIASNLEVLSGGISDEKLSMYLLRSVVLKTRYLLRVLTEISDEEDAEVSTVTSSTPFSNPISNLTPESTEPTAVSSIEPSVPRDSRRRSTQFTQMLNIINADVSTISIAVAENLVISKAEQSGGPANDFSADATLVKPSSARRKASIFVRMPSAEQTATAPSRAAFGTEPWNGDLTMVKSDGLAKACVGGVILDLLPDKFDPMDPSRRPVGWSRIRKYRLDAAEKIALEQGATEEVILLGRSHRESEIESVMIAEAKAIRIKVEIFENKAKRAQFPSGWGESAANESSSAAGAEIEPVMDLVHSDRKTAFQLSEDQPQHPRKGIVRRATMRLTGMAPIVEMMDNEESPMVQLPIVPTRRGSVEKIKAIVDTKKVVSALNRRKSQAVFPAGFHAELAGLRTQSNSSKPRDA